MGVKFIEEKAGEGKDFSEVRKGEVVILPAFGASVHEMKLLNDRGVQIVDTTCPWVSKARALSRGSRAAPRCAARAARAPRCACAACAPALPADAGGPLSRAPVPRRCGTR